MFPLSWWNARCNNSPAVIPHFNVIGIFHHNYRFYCKNISYAHFPFFFVRNMIHIRAKMHLLPYSMSSKERTNWVSEVFCHFINSFSNLRIIYSRPTYFNCLVHCISSYSIKFLNIWMHIPYFNHQWIVTMTSMSKTRNININRVSRSKWSVIWNTMT